MKTEYQARWPNAANPTEWIMDADYLRENARQLNGAQLWRRETETPEEAAVRRMAILQTWTDDADDLRAGDDNEPWTSFLDRLSPSQQPTETQVDWDTLEPIEEVPVWLISYPKVWIAGIGESDYGKQVHGKTFTDLLSGRCAIGSTRANALRNLAELQSIKR